MKKFSIGPVVIAVGLAFPLATSGCVSREKTVQLEEVAFLTFDGVQPSFLLQVDEGEPTAMKYTAWETRYKIAPGRRRIRVWEEGNLIVDRLIFLSRGQTVQITLP